MLEGLYIFLDDDFTDPIYADPEPDELDREAWVYVCERVNDALEDDGDSEGTGACGEYLVGWRVSLKSGLSFVAVVTDDVRASSLQAYLTELSQRYADEVDDPRNPEREGVEDVVVDVIPAWEDEED